MSHFTTIDVQIRDIEALRQACHELQLEVVEQAEARGYAQNTLAGDYVIRLPGPYDIAVQARPDGTHQLVADLWQGHVEAAVGPGFGRLKQLYGVHATQLQARRRGLSVRRNQRADGSIQLTIGGLS